MPASPALLVARLVALAAATVTLAAGCGGTADEPTVTATESTARAAQQTTSPATPGGGPTEEPADDSAAAPDGATVIEVTVAGGSVSTAEGRVEVPVGSPVRLVVTGDTADELHVHGVDVEVPLAPGQPAVLDFVPSEPGLYDVETHDSQLLLVQVAAR